MHLLEGCAGITFRQDFHGVVEEVDGVGLQEMCKVLVELPVAALLLGHPPPRLPVRRDVPQVHCRSTHTMSVTPR